MICEAGDAELCKRGVQSQGVSYWLKGKLDDAIQAYEKSLGELDSIAENDFSMLIALNMALCYAQAGIPQRGLGICETVEHWARKNSHLPLVSYALAITGVIFLEIRQLKNSRTYFERALELSGKENIPMAEIVAGTCMAVIECHEGNLDSASEHFKVLWKIRKSSWYHTLNNPSIFEAGYTLHVNNASPFKLNLTVDYLKHLKEKDINPFMYAVIRRRQIQIIEREKTSPGKKIGDLLKLETSVEQCGAKLELAKIRIDLARLYVQTNNWKKAETYGILAWEFLKPIAKDVFPHDLKHLIPLDKVTRENRLFDLVVEMGEALINQENIEQLLTNIITSLSRLTGAERAALFIKDRDSSELRMVASRNLLTEHIMDEQFKDTFKAIRAVSKNSKGNIIQYKINEQDSVDFRHVIITPLKVGNKIIGALYQDSRFFSFDTSPERINLLSALASQIAVSIDRAQAYDEIARLNKRLIQENLYYVEEKEEFRPFGDIVGESKTLLKLQHLISKVAPTQSTALITGETGVGKELVARAIHRRVPGSKGLLSG